MKSTVLIAALIFAVPAAAQSDGPKTRAEVEKQQTRKYQRYDVNKDGFLTAEELMQVRPTRKDGSAYEIDKVRKALAKQDTDGDGKTSIAEAVAWELTKFDKMDTDKDGTVTSAERTAQAK